MTVSEEAAELLVHEAVSELRTLADLTEFCKALALHCETTEAGSAWGSWKADLTLAWQEALRAQITPARAAAIVDALPFQRTAAAPKDAAASDAAAPAAAAQRAGRAGARPAPMQQADNVPDALWLRALSFAASLADLPALARVSAGWRDALRSAAVWRGARVHLRGAAPTGTWAPEFEWFRIWSDAGASVLIDDCSARRAEALALLGPNIAVFDADLPAGPGVRVDGRRVERSRGGADMGDWVALGRPAAVGAHGAAFRVLVEHARGLPLDVGLLPSPALPASQAWRVKGALILEAGGECYADGQRVLRHSRRGMRNWTRDLPTGTGPVDLELFASEVGGGLLTLSIRGEIWLEWPVPAWCVEPGRRWWPCVDLRESPEGTAAVFQTPPLPID